MLRFRHNILSFICIAMACLCITTCATKGRKNSKKNRVLKEFRTQYNTLFNAEEAYKAELTARKTAFQDNFYDEFLPIFPLDSLISNIESMPTITSSTAISGNRNSSREVEEEAGFGAEGKSGNFGKLGMPTSSRRNSRNDIPEGEMEKKPATRLEVAEAKAKKAIDKFGFVKNGEETNKKVFDAYLLIAKARIFMGKPLQSLDAFNFLFSKMKNDKRINEAYIWQAVAYTHLGNFNRANELFERIKSKELSSKESLEFHLRYADLLIRSKEYDRAISELNMAKSSKISKAQDSRVSYILGQLYAHQKNFAAARKSFEEAYAKASDFEFEVKSQIEIAKTFHTNTMDNGGYNAANDYLDKISKKGTYASRKNEFLYAQGLLAMQAGKDKEADEYFQKSLQEKQSDPQLRGLVYEQLGKNALQKEDYLKAGKYYDSAVAVMTYAPIKNNIALQNNSIRRIAENDALIKKNDSILRIASLDPNQQEAYFVAYISRLKQKEASENLKLQKEQNAKDFLNSDVGNNSIFGRNNARSTEAGNLFGNSSGSFYFASTNTVSRGQADFRQRWGDRASVDNWRYLSRMSPSADIISKDSNASSQNPRRFEPSYYLEKIPQSKKELVRIKNARDTASLGLGRMYESFFGNTQLATKTLFALVAAKPQESTEQQALYSIFLFNQTKNPQDAERAKQILIEKYPYTPFAEFAKNPKAPQLETSNAEAEAAYKQAYQSYVDEDFLTASETTEKALQRYPKDALAPKFLLLRAFITGKTSGKDIMILQLQQLSLNYGQTAEGEYATEVLKSLGGGSQPIMRNADGSIKSEIPTNEGEEESGFGVNTSNELGSTETQNGNAPITNENRIPQRVQTEKIINQNPPIDRKIK